MIPIAALLNVETDDEEKQDGGFQMKAEPVDTPQYLARQFSSYTSSDEMEDDRLSQEDDDEHLGNQAAGGFKREHDALRSTVAAEASSLLGALTLQNLRFASAPAPATHHDDEAASRVYLSMKNLTNPMREHQPATEDTGKPLTPGQAARAARRRSTRSLFPGSSEEDRRAKQRMIVKRCYYKKISTINELRDQVQQLEQVLDSLLEEQEAQMSQDDGGQSPTTAVLAQYIDVVKEKEHLRHENQRLRKLADEYYMKNQGRLRVLLDTNRKDMLLFTPGREDD